MATKGRGIDSETTKRLVLTRVREWDTSVSGSWFFDVGELEATVEYGEQMLVIGASRKSYVACARCDNYIPIGSACGRPFGNANNRLWRICVPCLSTGIKKHNDAIQASTKP